VCGQQGDIPASVLSALSAAFIDKVSNLSVTLDGITIKDVPRVKSQVFSVALPKENVFGMPCPPSTELVPPGIYSPAVDDGFYVLLGPLSVGPHTLHFHAKNASQKFEQDVTYNLTVVPVLLH
jgi:hypothetical protein